MSNLWYINAAQRGNSILLTYVHDGMVKYSRINNYKPTLFYETPKETGFKELVSGVNLYPRQYDSIRDANQAIRDAHGTEGMTVYGNRNFNYTFLHENFKEMETSYDTSKIRGFFLDIECPSDDGFPEPSIAKWVMNSICIYDTFTMKYHIWGIGSFSVTERAAKILKEYKVNPEDVVPHVCMDENMLWVTMIQFWQENFPAYISGWNISTFDMPYMVNRMQRIGFDPSDLSPWGSVTCRENDGGLKVTITGVSILDYIDLYKKMRFKTRENYRLDTICEIELGQGKVDYHGVADNLRTLHKKDWELFSVYNVGDVAKVVQLEEKHGFINITFAIAYTAGMNYDDVSSPVATWENLFYREKIKDGLILPNKKIVLTEGYEGAFVKIPQVGRHRWVLSFDLNSLYPHIMMGWNMSPETIVNYRCDVTIDQMVDAIPFKRPDGDYAVAASGWCFRRDIQGVAGYMCQKLYNERKQIKNEGLDCEQDEIDILAGTKYEELLEKYNVQNGISIEALAQMAADRAKLKDGGQHVRKVLLNSLYGAMANDYFCMYDLRIAQSITACGQLAIRWIGRKINEYLNRILRLTEYKDFVAYGDTDSVYIDMEMVAAVLGKQHSVDHNSRENEEIAKMVDLIDKFAHDYMEPMIDAGYQELKDYCNSYQQKMVMKRECIADNAIFFAKKMYCMSVRDSENVRFPIDEPYIKVMGINTIVKSSTPAVVRDASKKLATKMLIGTETEAHEHIKSFKKSFYNFTPEQIAFPRGVNHMEDDYCDVQGNFIAGKTVPIQSRGSIIYNQLIDKMGLGTKYNKIKSGDKIQYVYLETPNPIQSNVIAFDGGRIPEEFDIIRKIDYETMYAKSFYEPWEKMMNVVGWEMEEIASLEDFFC